MLFYITFIDFNEFYGPGKYRKIKGQIEAMQVKMGEVYYTYYSYPVLYLMDGEVVLERQAAVSRRDQVSVLCSWIEKYRVIQTYIRYPLASKWLIDMLAYQKERHIKTILEIPTYPYDGELEEGITKKEDWCYRKEICKYVDRIATFSMDDRIWNVGCIRLKNGVTSSDIVLHKKAKEDKRIVLIAVGTMMFWQGYERIIEGMYLYYKSGGTYDLQIKMIGGGPEEQKYKDLVAKYDLQSKVTFIGQIEVRDTDRLNELYDSADIAVSSLGGYKKGLNEWSPIKGAEYCAKGLPFICGYKDDRFSSDCKFVMNVPNRPEPIDMNAVIDFYNKVTSDQNYQDKMRDYAMHHLTWDNIMCPVIDYYLTV
ncbi:MAG: glycosyltransferase [Lachnospiraceae bacterium]|nr:glycosyltransferase [Lachnospiraceae bacterium]